MKTVLRIYGLSMTKTFASTSKRPDRLWGPPASNSIAARGSFHGSKSAGAVKLTTHSKLAPSLRMTGPSAPLPTSLHGGKGDNLTSLGYTSLHKIKGNQMKQRKE